MYILSKKGGGGGGGPAPLFLRLCYVHTGGSEGQRGGSTGVRRMGRGGVK